MTNGRLWMLNHSWLKHNGFFSSGQTYCVTPQEDMWSGILLKQNLVPLIPFTCTSLKMFPVKCCLPLNKISLWLEGMLKHKEYVDLEELLRSNILMYHSNSLIFKNTFAEKWMKIAKIKRFCEIVEPHFLMLLIILIFCNSNLRQSLNYENEFTNSNGPIVSRI